MKDKQPDEWADYMLGPPLPQLPISQDLLTALDRAHAILSNPSYDDQLARVRAERKLRPFVR